jgi:hypothetical protein
VTTTNKNGKTIWLEEARDGAYIIADEDQLAVWVDKVGDYDYHACQDRVLMLVRPRVDLDEQRRLWKQ